MVECDQSALRGLDGVISVPGVGYSLLGSTRHGTSLFKRRLGVMGLSCCAGIEVLKVDFTTGLDVFLRADDHTMAPGDWRARRYLFDDA